MLNRFAVILLVFPALPVSVPAEEAVVVGSQWQLFLDDYIIEQTHRLTRTMHQPVKRGPVIVPDQPWETVLQTRCAPAWDEEKQVFKIWLITSTNIPGVAGTSYAESKDGVHWIKPALRQRTIRGYLENNFIAVVDGDKWPDNGIENVVCDPDDPDPDWRFKGFYGVINRRPMVSPDGIHWKLLDAAILPSSDESNLSLDHTNRTFIATLKRSGPFGRSHSIWTSTDFVHWKDTRALFHADEEDQRLARQNIAARLADPALQQPVRHNPADYNADIYNLAIFRYAGIYIGMPAVYHATGKLKVNTDGFHLIQLTCSRDLRSWTRLGSRQPFIGPSPAKPENFDRTQLLPPSAPVERGDELWFYYTGTKHRAPDLIPEADIRQGAVHLAVLRRDGFVSLKADEDGGELLTRPFIASGRQLVLNLATGDAGHARAEVLDASGNLVEGFSMADCTPVSGDHVAHEVCWESGSDVSSFSGKRIRLRIELKSADLYSFQFRKNTKP